ncbi:MAG: SAM-dependent methyltransferase [Cyanobacteria bacterium QH_6_48_35]|jgi:hypothetical protein|nr:MAG: SAM-dependent methyltransferase [Cyanobacteria bacterium QH_10_48_56]PSO65506.1 MAG: SAM-dependent methyltransferase [Cyanobacteria bacterium QH_6_48_35]
MNLSDDVRQYASATERNREPILEVLKGVLPAKGTILEVASGTGEHAVFFAPRLRPRYWLPSEANPQLRASITAWQVYFPADNLYPPFNLDVRAPIWFPETGKLPEELRKSNFTPASLTAIVSINLIHIAPWSACLGLMAGAGHLLPPGGILYLYGPFKQGGVHTAQSNAAFDEALRTQNPEWGVRDLDEVTEVASQQNLTLLESIEMPANNLSVVFQHN